MNITGFKFTYYGLHLIIDGKSVPFKKVVQPNKYNIEIGAIYLWKELGESMDDIIGYTPVIVMSLEENMFLCMTLEGFSMRYGVADLLVKPKSYSHEKGYSL